MFQAVEHDLASMLLVFWRDHIVDKETDGEKSEEDTSNDDDDVDSLSKRVFGLRSKLEYLFDSCQVARQYLVVKSAWHNDDQHSCDCRTSQTKDNLDSRNEDDHKDNGSQDTSLEISKIC